MVSRISDGGQTKKARSDLVSMKAMFGVEQLCTFTSEEQRNEIQR
jgi:hypothetical protein